MCLLYIIGQKIHNQLLYVICRSTQLRNLAYLNYTRRHHLIPVRLIPAMPSNMTPNPIN